MGWFKLWDDQWLENNKQTDLAVQGAMVRLMCVANVSFDNGRFTHRGKVSLTHEQIRQMADIDEQMWVRVMETGFVSQSQDVWLISGWTKYQNEYARKKGYIQKGKLKTRKAKDKPKVQGDGTSESPHVDVIDITKLKETKELKEPKATKELTEGKGHYQGETSPQVETFLGWYSQEFERRFNQGYLTDKAKDLAAAAKLLNAYGLEKTKELCVAGWESLSEFKQSNSMTVWGLSKVANELVSPKKTRKVDDKYNVGEVMK